ncbi:MAG: DUF4180 domain-containing protein [Bacteroidales bacterium]|jgi:hypothetical protein|nr:DUF4180 domain-containing protein [Bacteroidales bacterium]
MKFETLSIENGNIAVLTGDFVIRTVDDALDVIANAGYQTGYDRLIIHKENLDPDFFELKTGFAGEILQKFTTYRMKVGIIGDFSEINSKSLRDFIYESNKNKMIVFAGTIEGAIGIWYGNPSGAG